MFLLAASCFLSSLVLAQSVSDYAVRVSAVVQTNPARITLSWPASPATNYTVYRKTRDATTWGTATTLATDATNYADSGVTVGGAYEYRVRRLSPTGVTNEGYIYAGLEVPLVESRGKLILVVENTYAASLARELTRLQQDLVGDGWTVLRHDVSRNDSVASVKALIQADYNADTVNVKSVFLFGHVPVPYSGNQNPDGHPEHKGAWPADMYYGETTGTGLWTDTTVNTVTASDPRNRNVPGDGKFDQVGYPSRVDLQVGRVDLANLPDFSLGEGDLLRQYLDKDHAFRHRLITVESRGLIDDNFGIFGGEAFAVNGWRNFAPLVGATNTFEGDWLTTLATQSYLWGYGCGGGTYTSASGVADTTQLAASSPRVVFTMLFGSYFGDWDSQNNFLRAQLATPSHTLASAWAGRPHWEFHHMGLGETIGFSTRITQNNEPGYAANYGSGFVHVALMGDPTLRLHPVAPPAALTVATNGAGGVVLRWNAAPNPIAGYHVYRATNAAGPFTRLTGALITATNFTDPLVSSNIYMVRAVKLEVGASGSYYNPSQGIFQSLNSTSSAPAIMLWQPTNNAVVLAPNIQLKANTFDPANRITNVAFYANGVKIGDVATPPYHFVWSNVPLGSYSLFVSAQASGGLVTNSSPVMIRVDHGGVPQLTLTPLGNGSNAIGGAEILGRTYRIQFVPDLNSTNWQTLGSSSSNAPGQFQFIDFESPARRFYRTIFP